MNFQDYERIKGVIGDIYEENSDFLNTIPIDVVGLAKRMGFKIIYLSKMLMLDGNANNKKLEEYQKIISGPSIDGCSFYDKEKEQFIIYINDVDYHKTRNRFTIAHEIGHIVLNHFESGDAKENEIEANYFAGYLLLPDCIGIIPSVYEKLANDFRLVIILFGLSIDTANICFNHIENRMNAHPVENNYEKVICNCLTQAVLTKIRDL